MKQQECIHAVEYPADRPKLLLLHGVTRNHRDWAPMIPRLNDNWHVVALDHAGHGQSSHTPGSYRVIDYAHAVGEFMREKFDEPVVVFGHSLGAMVSLWLAAKHKTLVSRAILEDPPFHTMGRQIESTQYQALFAGMRAVACSEGSVDEITTALAAIQVRTPQGMVNLGDLRETTALRFSAECLATLDPDIFTPLVAGQWLDGFDYQSLWSEVRCPTLLLQGDPTAGGAFTDSDVAFARDRLRKSHHIRFDGIGHQIHASCAGDVLNAFDQFADSNA